MKFTTKEIDAPTLMHLLEQYSVSDHGGWLYHQPAWLDAVADGLGLKIYGLLTESEEGKPAALTPVMETSKAFLRLAGSPLRGSYTEFLGPLFVAELDDGTRRAILGDLDACLKRRRTSYREWRVKSDKKGDWWNILTELGYEYFCQETMVLILGGDAESAWKGFQGRARNMIRKAEKNGVTVDRVTLNANHIERYYTLLSETFERQGLTPPHPLRFYRAMFEKLSPYEWLHLLVAEHDGDWVAGAIFLTYGDRMVYLSGASTAAGRRLAANSLLQWEAVKLACDRGISEYDLGGTGNAGIDKFKASFGGRPSTHHCWRYRSRLAGTAERLYLSVRGAR